MWRKAEALVGKCTRCKSRKAMWHRVEGGKGLWVCTWCRVVIDNSESDKRGERKTMKPFNLQDALAGKPVVTRNGQEVKDIRYLPSLDHSGLCPIMGTVNGQFFRWTNTVPTASDERGSGLDLFMRGEKKIMWGNVYRHTYTDHFKTGILYATQTEAIKWIAPSNRETFVATIKVEWEE